MRNSLALMAMATGIATPVAAVEVFPMGSDQYEIVQEVGLSYSQDERLRDATRFCAEHKRQFQVIADMNSLRFACVRRE